MAFLHGSPGAAGTPTSESISTSLSPHRPGVRMHDESGNEYVWCDFTGTVSAEQPVEILSDRTAGPLGTTGRGAVGVACGAGTSDQSGWVQVYGRAMVMIGKSGVSPSDAANGPTTAQTVGAETRFVLGTSATSPNGVGMVTGPGTSPSDNDFQIIGMYVAQDASPGDVSGVTSATSHTGNHIGVWLNYPYIKQLEAVSTS